MMVSFVLSFFPRDVLDEILNLIESVSEDFPSYSCYQISALKTVQYLNTTQVIQCILIKTKEAVKFDQFFRHLLLTSQEKKRNLVG